MWESHMNVSILEDKQNNPEAIETPVIDLNKLVKRPVTSTF